MSKREETCCFTGHRPGKLPWQYNEQDPRCLALKRRIADAVEAAWDEGCRHFICGMALGCDLYFCEAVLDLRRAHPGVTVEAAIPCPGQDSRWRADQRLRYRTLVAACVRPIHPLLYAAPGPLHGGPLGASHRRLRRHAGRDQLHHPVRPQPGHPRGGPAHRGDGAVGMRTRGFRPALQCCPYVACVVLTRRGPQ